MLQSVDDFERAVVDLEHGRVGDLQAIKKAFASRSQFMPARVVENMTGRLDRLTRAGDAVAVQGLSFDIVDAPVPRCEWKDIQSDGVCMQNGNWTIQSVVGERIDATAEITCALLQDCKDCEISLGVCSGAVYLKNIQDCTVHVACHQLRMVNCSRVCIRGVLLTSPVIEECEDIQLIFEKSYASDRVDFANAFSMPEMISFTSDQI